MKIVTLGSVMYDLFIDYPFIERIIQKEQSYIALPEGRKMEVDRVIASLGGGASNSAVSFTRLGIEASVCAKVGNDSAAEFILNGLQKQNVYTGDIVRSDTNTGTSYIILSPSGDHAILVCRGSNLLLSYDDIDQKLFDQADLLYITSLTGNTSVLLPYITAEAAKKNIRIAANPGTSQLTRNVDTLMQSLPHIEILILISYEARLLMAGIEKKSYKEQSVSCDACSQISDLLQKSNCEHGFDLIAYVKIVHALGPRIVVVTHGAHGVYVSDGNKIYYHPSITTQVISSVGAGDAFGSAFVAFQAMGKSVEESLYAGLCNSNSVLQYMNAQDGLLTMSAIKNRLDHFDKAVLKIYQI